MSVLQILVCILNVLLLLGGSLAWVTGVAANNPSRKRVGVLLLSAWLVCDAVTVILAWSLGWFS